MKNCNIKDCPNPFHAKGMCRRHYSQTWGLNHRKERIPKDLNEFVVEGNICKIFLYDQKSEKIAETIIDVEDFEKCKGHKWGLSKGYVRNRFIGSLAGFLLNVKTTYKIVVDHKNGNSLDNKKSNLQVISNQQNKMKQKPQRNNTSGHRGVTWDRNCGKWYSQIGHNGKANYIGSFLTKAEAAFAYNEKAKELFGEFAILNNIRQRGNINDNCDEGIERGILR